VALSPGRKWLVGWAEDGFRWLRVSDCSPVGTLRLPAKLPFKPDPAATVIAISPDGTRFAACLASEMSQVILTWDVATGALRDAVALRNGLLTFLIKHRGAPFSLQWTGPRSVLLSQTYLVDLDLRVPVYRYRGTSVVGLPDERVWQRGVFNLDDLEDKKAHEQLLAAVKETAGPPPAYWQMATVFYAAKLPYPALTARLESLRGLPLLAPEGPIRLEVAGGPTGVREKLAADLAAGRRAAGIAIDPKAPVGIRFNLDRPFVERRNFSTGPLVQMRVQGGVATPGGVDRPMVIVRGTYMVLDAGGRVAWEAQLGEGMYGVSESVEKARDIEAAAPDAVAKAREEFVKMLPHSAWGVGGGGGPEYTSAMVIEKGKRVFFPFESRQLPLDGIVDGAVIGPTPIP
jgi:hypothetical protein